MITELAAMWLLSSSSPLCGALTGGPIGTPSGHAGLPDMERRAPVPGHPRHRRGRRLDRARHWGHRTAFLCRLHTRALPSFRYLVRGGYSGSCGCPPEGHLDGGVSCRYEACMTDSKTVCGQSGAAFCLRPCGWGSWDDLKMPLLLVSKNSRAKVVGRLRLRVSWARGLASSDATGESRTRLYYSVCGSLLLWCFACCDHHEVGLLCSCTT